MYEKFLLSFDDADKVPLLQNSASRPLNVCGDKYVDEFEECDYGKDTDCCKDCLLTPGSTCHTPNGWYSCCHNCRAQPTTVRQLYTHCAIGGSSSSNTCAGQYRYQPLCRIPTPEDPCRELCKERDSDVCGKTVAKISNALCKLGDADGMCVRGTCKPVEYEWFAWKPRCTCPEDKGILTRRKVACTFKNEERVVASSYCDPALRPSSYEACCPPGLPVDIIVGVVMAAVFILLVLLVIYCLRKHRTCCWAPLPGPSLDMEMISRKSTAPQPCAVSTAAQQACAPAPQHSHAPTSTAATTLSDTYAAAPSSSSSLASASPMALVSLAAAAYGAPPLTTTTTYRSAPAQPPSYAQVRLSSHPRVAAPSQQAPRSLKDAPETPPPYSSL